MNKNNFQSPLSRAKGLGSSGTGTTTWWAQRVSAVALVPLVIWFAYFIIKAAEYQDLEVITSIFTSPFSTLLLALFIGMGLYHGNLGMKEIIEDYVHCHAVKISLIIFLQFFSFITAISGICAIFAIHLSTFSFN